jgi:hypothetical protein
MNVHRIFALIFERRWAERTIWQSSAGVNPRSHKQRAGEKAAASAQRAIHKEPVVSHLARFIEARQQPTYATAVPSNLTTEETASARVAACPSGPEAKTATGRYLGRLGVTVSLPNRLGAAQPCFPKTLG